MQRIHNQDTTKHVDKSVRVSGWVAVRRDHGKLVFIDLRDASGLLQVVFNPQISAEAHKLAQELRSEFVVEIEGKVNKRPEKLVNPRLATGAVELEATKLAVLSRAETLPFELDDTSRVGEDARLRYRYLDLRSERMARNIRLRALAMTLTREFLNKSGFMEIETPILTKTSPEGARDFLVPSRMQPGKFYALPQAPQQYKQLLMIAGFERYYQLAKALRDEDLRGDRQPEHAQIDLEMSFVSQDDILDLVEKLMVHIVEGAGKKILEKPFPRITHEEAMKKYKADKFDLRKSKDQNAFAFAWVTDFPLFERDENTKELTFAHNPFSRPADESVAKLMREEGLENLRAQQYDLVCNGYEIASGGLRISDPAVQRKVFEILGLSKDEIDERFGHLLRAYEYGAPPHGGIAVGFDRLVMLLAGEENIREVIAFPVSSSGQTSVMDAPSEPDSKQLKDLHIRVEKPKNNDKNEQKLKK